MAKLPIRNKSKDNPYTLDYDENIKSYIVEFKDNKNNIQRVEISDDVYNAFNEFELEDVSQIHKYQRHIEHNEIYEETLYKKSVNKPDSIEEIVSNKILIEKVMKEINMLSNIQKRRIIKHYLEDKTYEEIAKEENCSKVAVKLSIDIAIRNISKKIKN